MSNEDVVDGEQDTFSFDEQLDAEKRYFQYKFLVLLLLIGNY